MDQLTQILDQLPWSLVLLACLTLGLAPFVPEPHLWEKLKMLAAGTLVKPIDIFDLLMHAAPVPHRRAEARGGGSVGEIAASPPKFMIAPGLGHARVFRAPRR